MINGRNKYEVKNLIAQSFITLMLFALMNVGLRRLAMNTPSRTALRSITTDTPSSKVLLFGNSLIAAGIDEAEFIHSGPAKNVGVGATTMVEHRLLINRVEKDKYEKPTIIEGFFDFQLLETPPASLVGTRAFSYYESPPLGAKYYTDNPFDKWIFQAQGYLPFLTERSNVWEKVEKLRREISRIDMPSIEENRFGRVEDFNALETGNTQLFRKRCSQLARKEDPLTPETKDFILTARRLEGRVIFVEMPMSPYHRTTYYDCEEWRLLRIRQRAALVNEGVEYVNASEWIQDERHFADHLHLNAEGAKLFSRRLDAYVAGTGASNSSK